MTPTNQHKELQTIAYYNNNAEQYLRMVDKSFWLPEITLFQEYLPHGHILDVGCAGATEGTEFIKKNYQYTGIDPAQTFVDRAKKLFPKKKYPQVTFLNQNIYTLNFPESSFDGFWCSAVLLHVPKEKINVALQQIKQVMKQHALGFISLAEGSGEYFDINTGRYFHLYEHDEFITLLQKNGFEIVKQNIRNQNTHKIWLQSWLTFFVRANK